MDNNVGHLALEAGQVEVLAECPQLLYPRLALAGDDGLVTAGAHRAELPVVVLMQAAHCKYLRKVDKARYVRYVYLVIHNIQHLGTVDAVLVVQRDRLPLHVAVADLAGETAVVEQNLAHRERVLW